MEVIVPDLGAAQTVYSAMQTRTKTDPAKFGTAEKLKLLAASFGPLCEEAQEAEIPPVPPTGPGAVPVPPKSDADHGKTLHDGRPDGTHGSGGRYTAAPFTDQTLFPKATSRLNITVGLHPGIRALMGCETKLPQNSANQPFASTNGKPNYCTYYKEQP
jgi:hypothetical protein